MGSNKGAEAQGGPRGSGAGAAPGSGMPAIGNKYTGNGEAVRSGTKPQAGSPPDVSSANLPLGANARTPGGGSSPRGAGPSGASGVTASPSSPSPPGGQGAPGNGGSVGSLGTPGQAGAP